MKKGLLAIFSLAILIIASMLVFRYKNTIVSINSESYHLGKYKFQRIKKEQLSSNEGRIIDFSYATSDAKYFINYRFIEPISQDTTIYFSDKNDKLCFFDVQSEHRAVFYKPIERSMRLKALRIGNKFELNLQGKVFSKNKTDSLTINSMMTLQPN